MNLMSLCPKCDCQVWSVTNSYGDRMQFSCIHCGNVVDAGYENQRTIEQKVELLIHRELRTGEWRNRISPESN
jgi:predicted nucleic-acid-binding Zn-ribbon protein